MQQNQLMIDLQVVSYAYPSQGITYAVFSAGLDYPSDGLKLLEKCEPLINLAKTGNYDSIINLLISRTENF